MPALDDMSRNADHSSVEHFGREWARFDQQVGWGDGTSLRRVFDAYFAPLPAATLNPCASVGDFGAGSGRWAKFVAPKVRHLYVVEPSTQALAVARKTLDTFENVTFIDEPIGGPSMPAGQLDVAYALGVIHHVPDPTQALRDIRAALKPGGWFLAYVYYALDNRPAWFRALWRASDRVRSRVSRLPARRKRMVTDTIATVVYWPLARAANVAAAAGLPTSHLPLRAYADKTLYVMRNDALDRFGTPLEHRFTRNEIEHMLAKAGFDLATLHFAEDEPFWRFAVRTVSRAREPSEST